MDELIYYNTMPAGDEMDTLVHHNVMKAELLTGYYPPHYSTDISAAWKIVEKLIENPYIFPQLHYSHNWVFEIWKNNPFERDGYEYLALVYAETVPLAICRAALIAITKLEN